MKRFFVGVLLAALTGCTGIADYAVAPEGSGGGGGTGPTDAGMRLQLSSFQAAAGLPTGLTVQGAAQLSGVIDVATTQGTTSTVYGLTLATSTWADTQAPLMAGEKATQVLRDGLSIRVTAADATGGHGGVLAYDFGEGTWHRTTAPDSPAWALLARSAELLLSTRAGLFASADGETWTARSTDSCVMGDLTFLVGSPSGARVFAVNGQGLCHSDDEGHSWAPGPVNGTITALAAADQYVLLESSTDGAQRSDNYGSTFHPFAPGTGVAGFALVSGKSFAFGSFGLKVSDDGGDTFTDGSNGLPAGQAVDGLFPAGSDVVASVGGTIWLAALQASP